MKRFLIAIFMFALLVGCTNTEGEETVEVKDTSVQGVPYNDTEYGFTLNYPEKFQIGEKTSYVMDNATTASIDWSTNLNDEGVFGMGDEDIWVTLSIQENVENSSLEELTSQRLHPGKQEDIMVDGHPAFRFKGNLADAGDSHNGFGILSYFESDGQFYTLTCVTKTESTLTEHEAACQSMVESFEFTSN